MESTGREKKKTESDLLQGGYNRIQIQIKIEDKSERSKMEKKNNRLLLV